MESAMPTCREDRRRYQTRQSGLNGIDYLEVSDDQRSLYVHLFGPAPAHLSVVNLSLRGGRRVRDIRIVDLEIRPAQDEMQDHCLRIRVDRPGDFSTYTLCIVAAEQGRPTDRPHPGFDPRYACIDFSFKAGCPSDQDCVAQPVCPLEPAPQPAINYLARDYASFRQLILDRLSLLMPDWRERHVPDIGIALVEVLAYVGDYLSYYQDAVATEAYLDTARERISVKRHVRLVDYPMHEGCNARAWVCIDTDVDVEIDPGQISFITACAELGRAEGRVLTPQDLEALPRDCYEVFEPLMASADARIHLYQAFNQIEFYTWAGQECCLPRGSTQATLQDPERLLGKWLKEGDILIFEEVLGPVTGAEADADPAHRHAVRLIRITPDVDPLTGTSVMGIEWASADALPFPLCLAARLPAPGCTWIEAVSVARGNVVLVDHGQTVMEPLGQVGIKGKTGECLCQGTAVEVLYEPAIFRPVLTRAPLTFRAPLPGDAPASGLLRQEPREAVAQIKSLVGLPGECEAGANPDPVAGMDGISPTDPLDPRWQWSLRRDLLSSLPNEQHFVVEIDNEGRAHLRFGDGELGRKPDACSTFQATYRVANGPAGNVGAETIAHIVTEVSELRGLRLTPRNPLPAQGGIAPEPLAEVKLLAPYRYRRELQRAIIAEDYALIAERNPQVQRAAATLNWTGSWYEAQVAVDPLEGTREEDDPLKADQADDTLLRAIEADLEQYRRMGHDLEVVAARAVPLDLELEVCVLPHFLRSHVEAAILERLGNRVLPDGTLGFFHPDSLTFGDGVYLSRLVAAVQAIPGVKIAQVTRLERQFEGPNQEIENGILPIGPTEIPQLENDPSFPEHGQLALVMRGGR